MKKKDSRASERISAMMLGGSILSSGRGSYKGPLFARKKSNLWPLLTGMIVFMLMGFVVWGALKKYRPRVAENLSRKLGFRNLAGTMDSESELKAKKDNP